jgi:hypothetical protein
MPNARIFVTHMEGVNHYVGTRAEMAIYLLNKGISKESVAIPEDGELFRY